MNSKPFYLAGPMTGIPNFNFPLFKRAAEELRDRGWDIVSPVELDSQAVQDFAAASADGAYEADGKIAGETWGDMLARDVKLLADQCQGIILLPDWDKSRGARLEAFVNLLCGGSFYIYLDGGETVGADMDKVKAVFGR